MALALSIKLILAHLLGDFIFQPQKWIEHKASYKYKSKFLYWHILVHFISLIVVLKFDFSYWLGILIIITTHYGIDLLKLQLSHRINPRALFVLDQVSHLIVIALVVRIYALYTFDFNALFDTKILLTITALLTITVVTSVIMKILISKWNLEEDIKGESLENAGAYIGMLERLFVFLFVVLDYWEGIGFLIAAKSVFRFGDLSKAKDRKLTEYILIGTLLSFGLAIAFSLSYKIIIQQLP